MPGRVIKTVPVRQQAATKSATAMFCPEESKTSNRAVRVPMDAGPARVLSKQSSHLEPKRPIQIISNSGAQHPPSRPREYAPLKQTSAPHTDQLHPGSRPPSRSSNSATSSVGAPKPIRPMSIREKLMGGARRAQQFPQRLPEELVPVLANKQGSHGPMRVEKKVDESAPKRSVKTDGSTAGDTKSGKLGEAKSDDRRTTEWRTEKVREAKNVAENKGHERDVAIKAELFGPTKSQVAKTKSKPVVVSPRKARVASNRGIHPLAIRKAMKARNMAKGSSGATLVAIVPSPALETHEEVGQEAIANEGSIHLRSVSAEEDKGAVGACDGEELIATKPEEGVVEPEGDVKTTHKAVTPTGTRSRRTKRLPPMTPISRLAEEILQGFEYTICLDETMPYERGEGEEGVSCGTERTQKGVIVNERRVLCESNGNGN